LRNRSVGIDAHDLAKRRAEILRRIESLAVARSDEQRAVRRKGHLPAKMTAADGFGRLPPNDRHVLEFIALEPPARDGKPFQHHVVEILIFAETGIAFILGVGRLFVRGLGIGEINEMVAAEIRIDRNGKQASLLVVFDLGHAAERLRKLAVGIETQIAGLLGDEQAVIGQKRH
jgi:hypothetical protein